MQIHQLDGHRHAIRDITNIKGLNNMFATVANDGCVRVWLASSGNCIYQKQLSKNILHAGNIIHFGISGSI